MQAKQSMRLFRPAIVGSVIVAAVLIIGTFWMGRSAGRDTENAVRNVSLLYLDELAGRREQVVAATLKYYISEMDVAIGLIEKTDLQSMERLQAYQARMKQLYGLEKFAFVDENGLIYTSRGTRTDINQYHFDYTKLSEPGISIKNIEGENKKVIIAVPVDRLPFEGKTLVVCFMEIAMEHFLNVLSLQTDTNGTTFCNIYTSEGKPLTGKVLGGLAPGDNLLQAMEQATFEDNYQIESMREHFAKGEDGVVSFTYKGIKATLSYVPIRNTKWMLTYLIRESVISDQIATISNGIIKKSLIQTVLTGFVLLVIAVVMLMQMKKAAKLAMEKETSDALQKELEERLSLQSELLEQEKMRAQQDSMITALASDYRSVYYVDLERDEGICYRNDDILMDFGDEGTHFPFHERFAAYADHYVDAAYREVFLHFIEPAAIRAGLEKTPVISIRYLIRRNGIESYEMLRMASVMQAEDRGNCDIRTVGVGFSDIDAEMRDSMARSQALSDALKTAEEASKAKTIFLSNMSHEIRTPMNAIIGLNSIALHEPGLSESTKGYLQKIGSSAHHLLSLINDILDMSRIESGRMVIRNEEFAFSKLMEQINTIFNAQCQEKGLTYTCRINGSLHDYYIGDSTKLRQILINILGNAVKFTPEGGTVDFIVEQTAAFDGKSTLRFTIHDTGIGMSKEYLPKLFDTFTQEDATAANKYGSSGLGMAITKNIVDMMNGKVEVESEKGVGSTFMVTVTLLDSDKMHTVDDNIVIHPQDMRVLVVDDDTLACDHAKLVLEQVGMDVEEAHSGREALEMVKLRYARRQLYNFIIVDWKMPEMDGIETTRAIRDAIGEEAAIIILTAYNYDDVLHEAIEAGVDSFVAKPIFPGNVIDEFTLALKKKHAAQSREHSKADLKGRRILLAEDMQINAEIICTLLEMREITTDVAENGKLAVELFARHPEGYYDAILMDMRMPEMNGLDATTAIRSLDRADAKKIPIIALTANAFDEDVQKSLQAGLNAHLSKPVQPDVLFETLENMIQSGGAGKTG